MYDILDNDVEIFIHKIDSSFQLRKKEYLKSKSEIQWSENFDKVALADLNFNYYFKKELYPYVHQYRTEKKYEKNYPKIFIISEKRLISTILI